MSQKKDEEGPHKSITGDRYCGWWDLTKQSPKEQRETVAAHITAEIFWIILIALFLSHHFFGWPKW